MKSRGSKYPVTHSLCLLTAVIALSTQSPAAYAQTFTLLHTFTGAADDGDHPQSDPVRDPKGNLYGAALGGTFGQGVVFRVTSTQKETVLYSFTGLSDGGIPDSISLNGSVGLLGTTYQGGANHFGTVFNLDARGRETVVYSFCPGKPCTAGAFPIGGVIHGNDSVYGITVDGGNFSCALTGCGTVFEINREGIQTVLHTFGGPDGDSPGGQIVRDKSGNIYGVTTFGGAYGYGTVFKLVPTGEESVMYSFSGAADGSEPYGGLYQDAGGNLYGTTSQGGEYNYGTVFKITAMGGYAVLHSFKGGAYGAYPYAGVVRDEQGNVFGTTYQGGADNYGTVFVIDADGSLKVLHSFSGNKDGAYPFGVIKDADGTLYGTTFQGGAYNLGTVYKLVP